MGAAVPYCPCIGIVPSLVTWYFVYRVNTSLIAIASRPLALQKIKISSPDMRCEIEGADLATLVSCIMPWSSACLRRRVNISAAMINNKGDNGSPCLKPRWGVKNTYGQSLKNIENETDD